MQTFSRTRTSALIGAISFVVSAIILVVASVII